jgi:RNA polymerase sigma-70 factor (ECF subfamily)
MDDIESEADVDLAKRLSLGEERALGVLIRRYQEPLARYVRRRCYTCRSEIEDILQDVFLRVFSHIREFDPGMSFSAWIYRIAHNQMVSRIRKTTVRAGLEPFDDNLIPSSLFRTDGPTEMAELTRHLHAIQERMPAKLRDVFVLRFLEEKDYGEIGDILKENGNTVATRIRRAREFVADEAQKLGLNLILEDS